MNTYVYFWDVLILQVLTKSDNEIVLYGSPVAKCRCYSSTRTEKNNSKDSDLGSLGSHSRLYRDMQPPPLNMAEHRTGTEHILEDR